SPVTVAFSSCFCLLISIESGWQKHASLSDKSQDKTMFNKRRLIPFVIVLTLAVALLTLASCISRPPASIPHTACNRKQPNTGGSSSSTTVSCRKKLLVFSKTGAFRHASIKDGKIALQKLADEHNF